MTSAMFDITSTLDELLRQHNAPPTRKTPTTDQVDEFLREAYKIHKHISSLHAELQNVRQAYLSTAQPRRTAHLRTKNQPRELFMTDADRDSLDANAKDMLHHLNRTIRDLAHAQSLHEAAQENLLRKKFASPLARLGKWAEGGVGLGGKSPEYLEEEEKLRQVAGHREGVLWFLRQRLQQCGQLQQSMMETRLTRDMEKNRSVLAKAKLDARLGNSFMEAHAQEPASATSPRASSAGGVSQAGMVPLEEEKRHNLELTDEQVQMFEKDNQDMLKHYQGTLDKVRTAEKSIYEISELQTSLVTNLEMQSAHIEQLVMDSLHTTENVDKGNRELKKAAERPSTARYTFFAATGLCAFMIIWDFFV